MEVKNITTELENTVLDNNAGIRLTKITGNENLSVYAAEILPKTQLNPHYHKDGVEIFQILSGSGIMKLGVRDNEGVEWKDIFEVNAGDCFTIDVDIVHQLINDTNQSLFAVFSTPESHTNDDRHFINE